MTELAYQLSPVPSLMGHILSIEYEYSRVYLNSLALQAVVERCTNATPVPRPAYPNHSNAQNGNGNSPRAEGPAIPPTTLMKWYGDDRKYINEVIDGCRNILKIVVEGLLPNEYLKHCPVRTYFRIIAVAVILLKVFQIRYSTSIMFTNAFRPLRLVHSKRMLQSRLVSWIVQ